MFPIYQNWSYPDRFWSMEPCKRAPFATEIEFKSTFPWVFPRYVQQYYEIYMNYYNNSFVF